MQVENAVESATGEMRLDIRKTDEQTIVDITLARYAAAGINPDVAAQGVSIPGAMKPDHEGYRITGH